VRKSALIAFLLFASVPLFSANAVTINSCLGSDLVGRADFEGATGAQEGGVVLTNRTKESCELGGHAIVDFVAPGQSRPLPVVIAAGRDTRGRVHDRVIILSQGQSAFVHTRWSNWCGQRLPRVRVRLWLRSVEPRVRVRGEIAMPRCNSSARSSRVAVGPYERVRRYHPDERTRLALL
jgi:hypothetical protein